MKSPALHRSPRSIEVEHAGVPDLIAFLKAPFAGRSDESLRAYRPIMGADHATLRTAPRRPRDMWQVLNEVWRDGIAPRTLSLSSCRH